MIKNKFHKSPKEGYHPIWKLKVILSGLRFAMADTAVNYKIILSVFVIVPSLFLHKWIDTSVIILATAMMVSAELFNTAIEALCDYMQNEFDTKIKIIKDVSAAATTIMIVAWLIVLAVEAYELFSNIPL